MFSPLEQFEIYLLKPFIFGYDLSFTIATVSLFLALLLFITFYYFGFKKAKLIPTSLQAIGESLYLAGVSMVEQQAGHKGLRYFPLFFTIFFLILFSNLVGLVPFAFAPTSHICFTLSLALTCNIAFIIIGFKENGLTFLRLFVPQGSPRFLLPLIVVIEFISYLLRTFSLSIRLFANIMAGHTLLHILASFVIGFVSFFPSLSIIPFIVILLVCLLEIGIGFLQAYVFVILLSIYLKDALSPTH